MSRSLTLLLVGLVALCGAAQAQQATLTLSHETAVWDDEIEARIEGVGCPGEAEVAVHFLPWAGWVVDIDLLHCDSSSTDSGLFWFFKEENIELTVKVLNGCALGDHFWVFLSSGSTVEHTVTVTDTRFGRKKTYTNDRGEAAPLIADTAAFSCDR